MPKKNQKKEANFGLIFKRFIEKNPFGESCQFELKDTRGKDYLNYDEVDEKQVNHALRSKTKGGNLIRIINGTPGAPDYVYLHKREHSFIVIRYPSGTAYGIDIDDFIRQRDASPRKSLTEAEAILIHTFKI